MIVKASKIYDNKIYIPKEIRDTLHLKNGDTIIWKIKKEKITLLTEEAIGNSQKPQRFKVLEG